MLVKGARGGKQSNTNMIWHAMCKSDSSSQRYVIKGWMKVTNLHLGYTSYQLHCSVCLEITLFMAGCSLGTMEEKNQYIICIMKYKVLSGNKYSLTITYQNMHSFIMSKQTPITVFSFLRCPNSQFEQYHLIKQMEWKSVAKETEKILLLT